MNPVLILTHNCLELTKKCVESVLTQDVDTRILLWDNASTDGTTEWMKTVIRNGFGEDHSTTRVNDIWGHFSQSNLGVSHGWNWGLGYFFDSGAEHVLVANNDTILPPWCYSSLLSYDVPFITGVSVNDLRLLDDPPRVRHTPTTGPDFSCFLIRRDAWEKIGAFEESMVHYCGDLDYDVRAHRAGLKLLNSHVPFYHERSSTLKLASPRDRREIELQADADREVFREKWGAPALSGNYEALFDEKLFGVDAK